MFSQEKEYIKLYKIIKQKKKRIHQAKKRIKKAIRDRIYYYMP